MQRFLMYFFLRKKVPKQAKRSHRDVSLKKLLQRLRACLWILAFLTEWSREENATV